MTAPTTLPDEALVHVTCAGGGYACGATEGALADWADDITCPECRSLFRQALADVLWPSAVPR